MVENLPGVWRICLLRAHLCHLLLCEQGIVIPSVWKSQLSRGDSWIWEGKWWDPPAPVCPRVTQAAQLSSPGEGVTAAERCSLTPLQGDLSSAGQK